MLELEPSRRHSPHDEAGECLIRASFACLDRLTFMTLTSESPDKAQRGPHTSALQAPGQSSSAHAEALVHLRAIDALNVRDIPIISSSNEHPHS